MADRRPRVLLGCDFFLRYTAMLAGGMERTGAQACLLTRDHDEEFGGRRGAATEFVERAVGPGVRRYAIPGRVRSAAGLRASVGVRRAIRSFAPEFIHLQSSIANDPRLLFAAGARPGRFALTVHDPVRHPGEAVSRGTAHGNQRLIRSAGLIFVHAEALREELVATAHPRAPIVVVPHGVDPGAALPFPERPAVLFFGRLGHYKGVDVLLDAMPVVWAEQPRVTLTIAGAGELPEHPALADPRVHLRSEHIPDADLPDLFAAATCVALPYRQASQSGVGSLAKRHGRPLVVSAVGGLPELVADGSGLAVAPEDPAALGGALLELLGDRELAERLGAAGSASAERGADWHTVAEATLAAYQEHLPIRRRRGGR